MNNHNALPDNYSLWMAELVDTKAKLLVWTQTAWREMLSKPEPVYYVEHPIYMTEVHECTQKQLTEINVDLVKLLHPASYSDYEKHLIVDVPKVRQDRTLDNFQYFNL